MLIDHQAFQLANVNSHEPTMVINNVLGLAKTAKVFNIPMILTTVNEQRGGLIFKTFEDVFPNQKPINRTFINAWEDKRVVDAVKKTGLGERYAAFSANALQKCPLPFSSADWIFEPKYDGFRALADRIRPLSPNLTERYFSERQKSIWRKLLNPAYSQRVGREELFERDRRKERVAGGHNCAVACAEAWE